ncbi:MAG: FKBP-type peptidyl-prolyl cis-trans isomerase [Isosphaeraceae bacterium]
MSKWTWSAGMLAVSIATLCGCEGPPALVPAVPPGLDARQAMMPKQSDKDVAEALGEQVAKSGAEPKKSVVADIPPASPTKPGEVKTTPAGVQYETIKEGTGAVAKAGQKVTVHYVGTLENGNKFDSSRDRGEPSTFGIGVGEVIRGWDEAVPGMKIGERRKLTIPPSAGYGAQGKGPIPPNATLIFEIELVDVQ